jgi:FkbM family methyltransferase
VHAYDHTIAQEKLNSMAQPERNFYTHKLGIALEKKGNFTTLEDELVMNDHEQMSITYLKIDVEGAERSVLPVMIREGLLDDVKQLCVEFQ